MKKTKKQRVRVMLSRMVRVSGNAMGVNEMVVSDDVDRR